MLGEAGVGEKYELLVMNVAGGQMMGSAEASLRTI